MAICTKCGKVLAEKDFKVEVHTCKSEDVPVWVDVNE